MSAPAAEVITIPVMVRHRGVFCILYMATIIAVTFA